ncbi:SgcJ/EcaC family oxidoreductase [Roseibacterium beibuensis]|nr:SgcJ/EcaC family oxidoreductase [Roseibacterium beibuensis]MCS6621865.1 SgcJ/EcaC family oxidoreductase [Roseibacterium beibuensis]
MDTGFEDAEAVADAFVMRLVAAWHARDGQALADLFAPDADFVNVVGIWWEDRGAIARAHQYALDSFFADTRLAPGRRKLRPLGPHHLLLHQRVRLSGQRAPDGSEAGARSTIFSFVLERRGADWLAVSAQNTDVVPGAETHVSDGSGLTAQDYRRSR